MNGFVGDTVYIICSIKLITATKRIKEQALKEIIAAICALLNSNGGSVVLIIDEKDINGKCSPSFKTKVSTVIRILEQSMICIIGIQPILSNIHFKEDKGRIVILVKKADSLITTNYNLYLPSYTQVVLVPPTESPEKIVGITNRKLILSQEIVLGSHQKMFSKNQNCIFEQSNTVQFKCLKSDASKHTTLADRITGKGNKFSCYVSAFANYNGGHIYYGINDDGVIEGQYIPSEDDKTDLTKKVEKAINKMIWPEFIGQPKRGEHWEIFFEPVVDEISNPIPSTFVIVIFIAPCLGGVFTDEPECYEMLEGRVEKMTFAIWKKRILKPVYWLWRTEKIPHSVERSTWSSAKNRKVYTFADQVLMLLLNNGNWAAILKKSKCLVNIYPQSLNEIQLLVLSKRITACYRRGHFNKAQTLLLEYTDILPQAQDRLIFEVLQLYLNAALKRALGDLVGLKEFLSAALSNAELIEPGLVPAIIYIFAATVTDLIKSEDQTEKFSPEDLSIRALQCLERVPDSSDVLADMKQKSHITLATFYLGCNICGQRIKGIEEVQFAEAKNSIMAVHESMYAGNALSRYREVQLNLVQSIYFYRYSQVAPDLKTRYLEDAFHCTKTAETLARNCQFTEMIEWSATHKTLCTVELLRTRLSTCVRNHSTRHLAVDTVKPLQSTDSEERELSARSTEVDSSAR